MRSRSLLFLVPVALACTPSDEGGARSIIAPGALFAFNDSTRIDRDGYVDLTVEEKATLNHW
ncbi:MAG: hypothetical protein ACJ785_12305, partial [Gemmatimonadaceae bacterium]